MCHQASFHLKFARKYPLLALKLPKSRVFSKAEAVKKGKKVAVVYFLTLTTQTLTVSNSISPTFKHWKMFILYDRNQCEL